MSEVAVSLSVRSIESLSGLVTTIPTIPFSIRPVSNSGLVSVKKRNPILAATNQSIISFL